MNNISWSKDAIYRNAARDVDRLICMALDNFKNATNFGNYEGGLDNLQVKLGDRSIPLHALLFDNATRAKFTDFNRIRKQMIDERVKQIEDAIINKIMVETKEQAKCPYCHNGSEMSSDMQKGSISIYHDKKADKYYLIASSAPALGYNPKETRSILINFCPVCGRDLRPKQPKLENEHGAIEPDGTIRADKIEAGKIK